MKAFSLHASIIIIFFIITGTTCRKEPKEKPIYYMSEEFKDYVLFPTGSYWVYEDTTTGIEDSIFLFIQKKKY